MTEQEEMALTTYIGTLSSTIHSWRKAIAREPSRTKQVYADALGWSPKHELRQKLAWIRVRRYEEAIEIQRMGVRLHKMREYADAAVNPWAD